jgi:hypothetical protein
MWNKILFAAIALGLWANAAATVIRPAHADNEFYPQLASMDAHLASIDSDINSIARKLDAHRRGNIAVDCSNCRE